MAIDWESRTTVQLEIMLASLLRYHPNAKTNREKENSKRSIAAIQKVLKRRKQK